MKSNNVFRKCQRFSHWCTGGFSWFGGFFFWRDFLPITPPGTTFCLWNSSGLSPRISKASMDSAVCLLWNRRRQITLCWDLTEDHGIQLIVSLLRTIPGQSAPLAIQGAVTKTMHLCMQLMFITGAGGLAFKLVKSSTGKGKKRTELSVSDPSWWMS